MSTHNNLMSENIDIIAPALRKAKKTFGNASNLCFGVISDIVCYFKGNRDGINRSNM